MATKSRERQRAEVPFRQPPFSETGERAILGSVFFDNDSLDRVLDIVKPADFFRGTHELVFAAMLELHKRRTGIDLVTVADLLRGQGKLEQAGGETYLAELAGLAGTSANIVYYARIVSNYKTLRDIIRLSGEFADKAYAHPEDVKGLVAECERDLFNLASSRTTGALTHSRILIEQVWADLDRKFNDAGNLHGITSGFTGIDRKLSGLSKSHLIIIAGRPGMGKTAFVLNVACNVADDIAKEKKPDWEGEDVPEAYTDEARVVALFSLEMANDDLILRMAASKGGIALWRLRAPKNMREDDWRKLSPALDKTADRRLFIDDTSDITVSELRSKCRRLLQEQGRLDLVVVDYLQLMRSTQKVEARHLEIADITRSLKGLAKELKVPVIALSQLSRKSEDTNEAPKLSHLRESGSIEQDADVVIFLHRPKEEQEQGEVLSESDATPIRVDVIIAKNRHGAQGDVPMHFTGSTMTFREVDEERE